MKIQVRRWRNRHPGPSLMGCEFGLQYLTGRRAKWDEPPRVIRSPTCMNDQNDQPAPEARRCAFFFDVDGTLAEIQPRPELVFIPPPTLAALERLHADGIPVAVISGRPWHSSMRCWRHCNCPPPACVAPSAGMPKASCATWRWMPGSWSASSASWPRPAASTPACIWRTRASPSRCTSPGAAAGTGRPRARRAFRRALRRGAEPAARQVRVRTQATRGEQG